MVRQNLAHVFCDSIEEANDVSIDCSVISANSLLSNNLSAGSPERGYFNLNLLGLTLHADQSSCEWSTPPL